jgi:DsbC/DsbD-like thiol-disulfide interchange protein
MMLRPFPTLSVVVVTSALIGSAGSVLAADASAWDRDVHSAVRLIVGSPTEQGVRRVFRAGVEITLEPNWKTYWRYPGDSGIPPRFDFSASTNLKDVQVAWPAPLRFSDGAGMSIGYLNRVIFPLRITAQDPKSPVVVRLRVDYAVCENLCVPVQAEMELALDAASSSHEADLRSAEGRVPRGAVVGGDGGLAIAAVRQEKNPKPHIVVDVRSAGAAALDLFAEGPNAEWSLPLPIPSANSPAGLRRFTFELDGLPPGADPHGAILTLTAVSDSAAIEVPFRLD